MYVDSKCIYELVEDTKKTTDTAEFGANGETNKNGNLHLGLNDLIPSVCEKIKNHSFHASHTLY